ncbi:MAG: BACON domain-containing protein [Bacteroidia bacterium]|nr:BACON domain-containing protein [Bacteroidia bacterium]
MNYSRRKQILIALLFCIALLFNGVVASAQKTFPAFPPKDVTSAMDRDQMLQQLGIQFPELPSKLMDPNRPAEAFPSDKNNPEGNWTDAAKHTFARSAFGLWNNYSDRSVGFFPGQDSIRLGNYSSINLLKMRNGQTITTVDEWWNLRRPEILKDLQIQLYGKIPDDSILPKVTWSVVTSWGGTGSNAYIQKEIAGTLDISRYPEVRNKPVISATLRTPASATLPVPVMVIFGGFGNVLESYWSRSNPNGWGICVFNLGALQPDNGAGLTSYLIGLVNKGNWRKPGDWGTLVAWSWGVSRLIDYFETDRDVNSRIIGLSGHSRYGKATLVTMAYEPRVAIGFPSDGGSLGTKMNRRHWGQDLENSTGENEYHWMAGNFFKWAGELVPGQYLPRKIENLTVDAHSLLALCAPRPVLLNGGNSSSWTDPYGQYLTTLYASPVYRLLGKKGIVMDDPKPIIDKAYIDGGVAFRYHNGGHTDAPEWPSFFEFASRHFDISRLETSKAFLVLGSKADLTAVVKVSSNNDWIVESSRKWLIVDSLIHSKVDSVKVSAFQNIVIPRSAVLTVSSKGRKQSISVFQSSAKPILKLSAKELSVGEKANSTVSFGLKSNSAWSISGTEGWLTPSEEAGIYGKEITLTASANPVAAKRKMVLTVKSPGIAPKTIVVTQLEAAPVINFSVETMILNGAEGSSASVMIVSNTPWTLKCSETWLSASEVKGERFTRVVFTAAENNGSSDRIATISVSAAGMEPKVIRVVQKQKLAGS